MPFQHVYKQQISSWRPRAIQINHRSKLSFNYCTVCGLWPLGIVAASLRCLVGPVVSQLRCYIQLCACANAHTRVLCIAETDLHTYINAYILILQQRPFSRSFADCAEHAFATVGVADIWAVAATPLCTLPLLRLRLQPLPALSLPPRPTFLVQSLSRWLMSRRRARLWTMYTSWCVHPLRMHTQHVW